MFGHGDAEYDVDQSSKFNTGITKMLPSGDISSAKTHYKISNEIDADAVENAQKLNDANFTNLTQSKPLYPIIEEIKEEDVGYVEEIKNKNSSEVDKTKQGNPIYNICERDLSYLCKWCDNVDKEARDYINGKTKR